MKSKEILSKWVFYPVCGGKTHIKIQENTGKYSHVQFPLYCPKFKHETLIKAEQLNISVIKEPAAKPQSR